MNLLKFLPRIFVFCLAISFFSCDDDDLEVFSEKYDYEEGDHFDVQFTIDDSTPNAEKVKTVTVANLEADADKIYVRLTFSSADEDMQRLYSNQSINGAAVKAHKLSDELIDGSLTIESHDYDNFDLLIPFPILNTGEIADGETVVYQIWATHGIGDYEDPTEKFELGIAELTVQY